ncbi:hypothetical protein ABVC73_09145 [Prevotella melaninogenica]
MREVFGLTPSEGSLVNWVNEAKRNAQPVIDMIKGWFYKLALLSFGFFLVQNVSSFSRVARYTPSLSCILTSKISSKSNKANL